MPEWPFGGDQVFDDGAIIVTAGNYVAYVDSKEYDRKGVRYGYFVRRKDNDYLLYWGEFVTLEIALMQAWASLFHCLMIERALNSGRSWS